MGDALWDGLTDSHAGTPMGVTAENLAKKYGITREVSSSHSYQTVEGTVPVLLDPSAHLVRHNRNAMPTRCAVNNYGPKPKQPVTSRPKWHPWKSRLARDPKRWTRMNILDPKRLLNNWPSSLPSLTRPASSQQPALREFAMEPEQSFWPLSKPSRNTT